MENQQENQAENAQKPKETIKFYGVSHQVNLGQGTDIHRHFAEFVNQNGFTAREAVAELLSGYRRATDDSELQQLRGENAAYEATRLNLEMEVETLTRERDEARQMANHNAEATQQALFEAQSRAVPDGAVVVMPGMVLQWLLDREAEKSGKKPADILKECFLAELQRVNSCTRTSVNRKELREISERLSKPQEQ